MKMSKQDFEMLGRVIWKAHEKAVNDLQNISNSMVEGLNAQEKAMCTLNFYKELVRSLVNVGFSIGDDLGDESERIKRVFFAQIADILAHSGYESGLDINIQIDTSCTAWPLQ
ncbi:hypothetical protein [Piscirickettsia salmonis]|uniref:hypothetical protein n=1 Tax=Piscirickettsia salmonis TaxID=1238 RepID=UPI003EB9075B